MSRPAKNISVQAYSPIPFPSEVFWDVDRDALDYTRDKNFIITRMFEEGTIEDMIKVMACYGKEETLHVLQADEYLEADGLYMAYAFFDVPLESFACYALLENH